MDGSPFPGLDALRPPELHRVRQAFPRPRVADPAGAAIDQIRRPEVAATLDGARTAAVAVGSRGIRDLVPVVAATVAALRERGIEPFIVPSMGSHGGGTAAGQEAVLAHLGVTEAAVGAPIRSSMGTRIVSSVRLPGGREVPLHVDALALEADAIVPINRVKPHTGFRGPVESGMCKMLAIGLGKHAGAATLHREGYGAFDRLILEAGREIAARTPVAFGVAVVENAYEETAVVEAVPASGLVEGEQALLERARELMPRIHVAQIDVLVVERFGKDVSGIGMDANVTGRGESGDALPGFDGPRIERIVVLDLTAATGGNAHGIGLADVITRRAYDRIDLQTTWINSVTSGSLACGRVPPAVEGDDRAIMAAATAVPGIDPETASVVRVRDTLSLTEIAVSGALLEEAASHPDCEVAGPWGGTWG